MSVTVKVIDDEDVFGLHIELENGHAIDLLHDKYHQKYTPGIGLWSGTVGFDYQDMELDEFRDWVTVAMGGATTAQSD